jgi:D-3-phosphoglycerate dehydrogenase / 2-oxoglutarate reductase
MNTQKIYFLNPSYTNFSIEEELLSNTGFELVPVRFNDRSIDEIADAVAILTSTDPISREIASQLRNCKVITRTGVGFDIIDVPACRSLGIEVCYVPDYGTEDVANHAIALLFALHRHLLQYHRSVANGLWDYRIAGEMHLMKELRLGIFGLGRIGSDFARKMQPFVGEILGYDPLISALQNKGIRPSSADEIFAECEIISLHLPLSAPNHHFIGDSAISKMAQKPILINVSRGGLVDTDSLIRGLRGGQLSGAGLDVLETEPLVAAELLQFENVILTPHAAWFSVEASNRLRRSAIADILRVLSGQRPLHPVPHVE